MKNLFHIVPFGPGFNIGNFLIQKCIRETILEVGGSDYNLISIPSRLKGSSDSGLTSKTIHKVNQIGDGVILGGGNLFENNDLDLDLHALDSLQANLFVFSASYGRIYNKNLDLSVRTDCMPDAKLKKLADKSSHILARDKATFDKIRQVVDTHSCLHEAGCPTVFTNRFFSHVSPKFDRPISLIAVRNPEQMNVPYEYKSKLHQIIPSLIDMLERYSNNPVYLYCNDQRDLYFARSFTERVLYTGDVDEYVSILKSTAACISFRVHTTIPLLSLGIPVINLSYDERSISLIRETLGYRKKDISFCQDVKVLMEQLEHALNVEEELSSDIINKTSSIQSRVVSSFLSSI